MMNRFACIVRRNLSRSRAGRTLTNDKPRGVIYCPADRLIARAGRYSTKASELKSALPKLWISKIKTAFALLDVNDDGYITEQDLIIWEEEMTKLFPNLSEEQKGILSSNRSGVWNDLFGGKEKGLEFKVTEDICIERFFFITTLEGGEDIIRKQWEKTFKVMDGNKDGVISKSEHRLFFESWKDPLAAIVAFTAIDQNMDGLITCNEFAEAGTEFIFNFTDETKSSNFMFGPLKF